MQFVKLLIVCVCGIVSLSCLAQCTESEDRLKKDITAQSTIYNIKRLYINDKLTKQQKPQKHQQHQRKQQQQQLEQHNSSNNNNLLKGDMPTNAGKPTKTKKSKNLAKNPHMLNKKLLNKLGFTKVKAPNSHNRKRLAIESRRHASPDDSHMFIIKLPPNMHYYTSPKAATSPITATAGTAAGSAAVNVLGGSAKNSLQPQSETEVLNANGKKVSFPQFNSNGKPGRIYHWNLPVIKKILEDRYRFPQLAHVKKDELIDIKDIPTWGKHWENETLEKSYKSSYKKSLKMKSPSYYAPAIAVNKNSFNKYFSGNGKPKGFYVIKENHKKPVYYKNIIS